MINAITEVFTGIGNWIAQYMPTIMEIFYNTEGQKLTMLGVLAICGLAVSIFFLLMGIIQNFLHFRG